MSLSWFLTLVSLPQRRRSVAVQPRKMLQCAASVSLMNWFGSSSLPGLFIPAKAVDRFQGVRSKYGEYSGRPVLCRSECRNNQHFLFLIEQTASIPSYSATVAILICNGSLKRHFVPSKTLNLSDRMCWSRCWRVSHSEIRLKTLTSSMSPRIS